MTVDWNGALVAVVNGKPTTRPAKVEHTWGVGLDTYATVLADWTGDGKETCLTMNRYGYCEDGNFAVANAPAVASPQPRYTEERALDLDLMHWHVSRLPSGQATGIAAREVLALIEMARRANPAASPVAAAEADQVAELRAEVARLREARTKDAIRDLQDFLAMSEDDQRAAVLSLDPKVAQVARAVFAVEPRQ